MLLGLQCFSCEDRWVCFSWHSEGNLMVIYRIMKGIDGVGKIRA